MCALHQGERVCALHQGERVCALHQGERVCVLFRDQCVLLCMLFTEWDIVRESKCCVATRAHQQVEVAPPLPPPPCLRGAHSRCGLLPVLSGRGAAPRAAGHAGAPQGAGGWGLEHVGGAGSMWAGLGAHKVSGSPVVPLWYVSKGGMSLICLSMA